jgi:hypothetical protein
VIPAHDRAVTADDEQAVVERFENVLVENTQPVELRRLEMQFAVQAGVLDGRRHLAGHRREERDVVGGHRLAVLAASERQHQSTSLLDTHGTK